ncbi:hypothetical protein ACFL6U_04160 [Planctomycetota bacterium]
MTKLLAQAFEKASKLPAALQDALAQELFEELAWEARWDKALEEQSGELEGLADKAFKEFHSGRTQEKGFDTL